MNTLKEELCETRDLVSNGGFPFSVVKFTVSVGDLLFGGLLLFGGEVRVFGRGLVVLGGGRVPLVSGKVPFFGGTHNLCLHASAWPQG